MCHTSTKAARRLTAALSGQKVLDPPSYFIMCVCVCVCEADWSLESDAEIRNACCTIYFHACHLRMGTNLPFTINPLMPKVSAHYALQKTFYFAFSWPMTYMMFSFLSLSYCAFNQHQRVRFTVVSNYSDQSLFPITEPKETAVDISSSGISAGITIQKCSFGGRSERTSSCHAAVTLDIHIS